MGKWQEGVLSVQLRHSSSENHRGRAKSRENEDDKRMESRPKGIFTEVKHLENQQTAEKDIVNGLRHEVVSFDDAGVCTVGTQRGSNFLHGIKVDPENGLSKFTQS